MAFAQLQRRKCVRSMPEEILPDESPGLEREREQGSIHAWPRV